MIKMPLKFYNEETRTLTDAIFCFTGKAPKTRAEMESIAIKAGASVTKSITNSTTILVIADANSMSSKAKKARVNGIDLISPQQFFDLCNETVCYQSGVKTSKFSIKHPEPIQKPTEKRKHSLLRRIEL